MILMSVFKILYPEENLKEKSDENYLGPIRAKFPVKIPVAKTGSPMIPD